MDTGPTSPAALDDLGEFIDGWLATQLAENPTIDAVDHDPQLRRWYVRIRGEQKDVYTVWLTMGQRSLHYETYVLPAPEENEAAFYEQLLRRNRKLVGLSFAIGEEDAVYLVGELANRFVDEGELDRILGSVYAAVELCFGSAARVGFASRSK